MHASMHTLQLPTTTALFCLSLRTIPVLTVILPIPYLDTSAPDHRFRERSTPSQTTSARPLTYIVRHRRYHHHLRQLLLHHHRYHCIQYRSAPTSIATQYHHPRGSGSQTHSASGLLHLTLPDTYHALHIPPSRFSKRPPHALVQPAPRHTLVLRRTRPRYIDVGCTPTCIPCCTSGAIRKLTARLTSVGQEPAAATGVKGAFGVITLHGRKPAREPFAFLTCSLISHFWAGHAVIFFGFLETLFCIRTLCIESNNWPDDPRQHSVTGTIAVRTVFCNTLPATTYKIWIYWPPDNKEKARLLYGGLSVHARANTDTHQSQAPPDNTSTLEHSIHIPPWATPVESLYA
jgi:hypothetical protein